MNARYILYLYPPGPVVHVFVSVYAFFIYIYSHFAIALVSLYTFFHSFVLTPTLALCVHIRFLLLFRSFLTE